MPIPSSSRQRPLEVRSNRLVGSNRGDPVITAEGTSDRGMPASFPGSADAMPAAKGFLNIPGGTGEPKVVSQHFSKSILQEPAPSDPGSGGPWSGVLAGELDQMGDHQPMAGVVPKNKPPF